jgi:ligand-binding SRPBCC domain-containing protein
MGTRRVELSSVVAAPRERVWAFYDDPANLARITPPDVRVTMLTPPARPRAGSRVLLKIGKGPFGVTWEAIFVAHEPPSRFVDEQGRGPFKSFRHEHRFEDAPGGTRMTDTIDYEPPFGVLGRIADRVAIGRILRDMLEFRHERTRELLGAADGAAIARSV